MSFCFHKDFVTVWGMSRISSVFANIFSYFTIMHYVEYSSWKTYKIIQEVGIGFVLLMVLNILIVSYSAQRKDKIAGFSISVQLLKELIWLVSSLLYLPLFQFFISIHRCRVNYEGLEVHYLFDDVYCF